MGKLPLPCLTPDPADGLWTLSAPWEVVAGGYRITMLPFFETDGASIPRALWPIIGDPFAAELLPAALTHDGLYAAQLLDRAQADAILLELLQRYGVGRIKARIIWAAVRAGGWVAWRAKKKRDVAKANRLVKLEVVK